MSTLLSVFGTIFFLVVGVSIYFLNSTSKEEAREMGLMTPKMQRDPEEIERVRKETPLHIKMKLEEAEKLTRKSQEADYEEGEDGVLRKKK